MKETKLERDCKDMASLVGWIAYKGFGRTGAPDKIFIKNSRVFTAEFKNPNKRQSTAQKEEQSILKTNGTEYRVIDNIDEFKKYLIEMELKFFR